MSNNENNQQFIAWSKITMITTGFWKWPISDNKLIQLCYDVYSMFAKFSYLLFWLLLIAEYIRMSLNDYPGQLKFQALSVVINATKITMKMFIYLRYDVLEMFDDVFEKEREVWRSTSEEIQNVYKAKIRTCKIFVLILGGASAAAVCFLQITGAFAMVQVKHQNLLLNETTEANFMYLTLFPRNKLGNLYLTFSLQALWGWVGMNYNSMTHIVFFTLLTYSAAQLELLQVKMKNFIESDITDVNNKEKISVLKSLIDEHKYIMGFVKYFNGCTRYVIMMEYILSSLDIASVSLNLIKMDLSQSEIGWRLFFLILLCFQIFTLGWSCNEVKVQSEAIANALYDSRWYLLNKEGRQLVEIIITRAQRPVIMTIGNFGPMTNNSAVLVVKAAYSYVSLFS